MDSNIEEKFRDLHKKIVDEVVTFCMENDIVEVDCLGLQVDCLDESVKFGSWHASTDSSMVLVDYGGKVILSSN